MWVGGSCVQGPAQPKQGGLRIADPIRHPCEFQNALKCEGAEEGVEKADAKVIESH